MKMAPRRDGNGFCFFLTGVERAPVRLHENGPSLGELGPFSLRYRRHAGELRSRGWARGGQHDFSCLFADTKHVAQIWKRVEQRKVK
jgi:hypothetical protein